MAQLVPHLLHDPFEVRVLLVGFIDDADHAAAVFRGVPRNDVGADLGAFDRLQDDHRHIGDAQRLLHLAREIEVPRRVQDVDLGGFPFTEEEGGVNGNLAGCFVGVKIGEGVSFFHFAEAGAQMMVYDVDGDGLADIITESDVFPAPPWPMRATLRMRSGVYSFIPVFDPPTFGFAAKGELAWKPGMRQSGADALGKCSDALHQCAEERQTLQDRTFDPLLDPALQLNHIVGDLPDGRDGIPHGENLVVDTLGDALHP